VETSTVAYRPQVSEIDLLRLMIRMRAFEEVVITAARAGLIHGELHLAVGQEAVAAGMVGTLRREDALVSTHRGHHHALAKEVPIRPLLAEICERATGLCGGYGGHMHLFCPEVNFSTTGIVGASIPLALGYAYAAHLEDHDRVAVAVTGDGGAQTGAFHEALSIAGAWKLPLVVVVENNQYAISVPISAASPTKTIAERSPAYGAWGRTVDGSDVETVMNAFADAVAYARSGEGPAILEAVCWRFRGHYEGDVDLYRPAADKDLAIAKWDPLIRSRQRLIDRKVAGGEELDAIENEESSALQRLLAEVQKDPLPDPVNARQPFTAPRAL